MRILVAEDDPTIRQLMSTLLSRAGMVCVAVDNGGSAVDAWEHGDFDAILMDVQMPGMDGLMATRIIREKEIVRGGHTPIIALTAHAMVEDRKLCLDSGMDEYITKPIDVEQLLELLAHGFPKGPH